MCNLICVSRYFELKNGFQNINMRVLNDAFFLFMLYFFNNPPRLRCFFFHFKKICQSFKLLCIDTHCSFLNYCTYNYKPCKISLSIKLLIITTRIKKLEKDT